VKAQWTMGQDQFGRMYHNLGKHPRKELMKRLGRKRAEKMYIEKKGGRNPHVGYIISGRWIQVYHVAEWEGGEGCRG
jgi:hypothetical protein